MLLNSLSREHISKVSCQCHVCVWGLVTVTQRLLRQLLSLLSSILTILLTCPNSDSMLCYTNDPFLTVYASNVLRVTTSIVMTCQPPG